MKLPRNLSGHELARALRTLGYEERRQAGSHLSIVTKVAGEHHVTIPLHRPIKPGTLNQILKHVADHHGISRDELIERLKL